MEGNAPQPIATTAERLKEALAHRHMTAAELCRHTGISSASMSQYMTGKVCPKQDRIYLMAVHLRVRPAWLMGYDIEPGYNSISSSSQMLRLHKIEEDPDFITREIEENNLQADIVQYKLLDSRAKMCEMFRRVDEDTRQAMLDRVQELYDLYNFRKSEEG